MYKNSPLAQLQSLIEVIAVGLCIFFEFQVSILFQFGIRYWENLDFFWKAIEYTIPIWINIYILIKM